MAFGLYGPFLGIIDSSAIVIGAAFFIFFAFLYFILSRIFRDREGNTNKAVAGVISFCMALLIVYFGRDIVYELVNSFNINSSILTIVVIVIFLIFAVWITKKLNLGGLLMMVGVGLIILSLTDLIYRTGTAVIAGIVLIILGYWLYKNKKEGDKLKAMNPLERQRYLYYQKLNKK